MNDAVASLVDAGSRVTVQVHKAETQGQTRTLVTTSKSHGSAE